MGTLLITVPNLGFNLYRAEVTGTWTEQLNDNFIPSQAPGSGQGQAYDWVDNSVEMGKLYYYWLEDVDVNGGTRLHGPVSVTVGVPSAVTMEEMGQQTIVRTASADPVGLHHAERRVSAFDTEVKLNRKYMGLSHRFGHSFNKCVLVCGSKDFIRVPKRAQGEKVGSCFFHSSSEEMRLSRFLLSQF
jgi:hypothetical protein